MAEYKMSWWKRLKINYHVWRAERLLTKHTKMRKKASEVFEKMKEHVKRAEKMLEEARW